MEKEISLKHIENIQDVEEFLSYVKRLKKDNTRKRLSCSKMISMITPEFNQAAIAKKTFEKNYDNPNSKYYKLDESQIIKLWTEKSDLAKERGRFLDNFMKAWSKSEVEKFKLENDVDHDDYKIGLCNILQQLLTTLSDNGYHFIDREIPVTYDLNYRSQDGTVHELSVDGRIDILFWNEIKNKFVIVDWKSNAEIKTENKFENLLGPMTKYGNADIYKYALQVYLYKTALANSYEKSEFKLDSSDIETYIIQVNPETLTNDNGFRLFNPARYLEYSKDLIDRIAEYCMKLEELEEDQKQKQEKI